MKVPFLASIQKTFIKCDPNSTGCSRKQLSYKFSNSVHAYECLLKGTNEQNYNKNFQNCLLFLQIFTRISSVTASLCLILFFKYRLAQMLTFEYLGNVQCVLYLYMNCEGNEQKTYHCQAVKAMIPNWYYLSPPYKRFSYWLRSSSLF